MQEHRNQRTLIIIGMNLFCPSLIVMKKRKLKNGYIEPLKTLSTLRISAF